MTLQGKVALVAGATRGAGRGIARALEHIDATVNAIIDRASPSPDDILLLTMRKPQLDFDDTRTALRARIDKFLK